LAFSRDRGWTWTVVTPHETSDANGVDRWNPWLAVGPDGRVDIVFYDTRNSIGRSGVDLYYAYSEDGGQTFGTPRRLTPVTSPNLGTSFEFGDYNGLDYLTAERFIAVYTDNRTEGSDVGDSPDVYATAPTATASDFISVNGAALQPPGGSVLYTHTVRVLQDGSAYSSRPGADTGVAVLELPHGRDIGGCAVWLSTTTIMTPIPLEGGSALVY